MLNSYDGSISENPLNYDYNHTLNFANPRSASVTQNPFRGPIQHGPEGRDGQEGLGRHPGTVWLSPITGAPSARRLGGTCHSGLSNLQAGEVYGPDQQRLDLPGGNARHVPNGPANRKSESLRDGFFDGHSSRAFRPNGRERSSAWTACSPWGHLFHGSPCRPWCGRPRR